MKRTQIKSPIAKRHAALFLISSVILPNLISGCSSEVEDSSSPSAFVSKSHQWDSRHIQVCWEESTRVFPTERRWVEDIIAAEYHDKTSVRLRGWTYCTEGNNEGIRIGVEDTAGSAPHAKGLGKTIAGLTDGLVLNFTFNNWSPSCRRDSENCIKIIAVHEFGHAVGLAHEQNRSDRPPTCSDAPQGDDGDQFYGPWDEYSVMNYCNNNWSNGGRLSAGDVMALEFLYNNEPLIPSISHCSIYGKVLTATIEGTSQFADWNSELVWATNRCMQTDHAHYTRLTEVVELALREISSRSPEGVGAWYAKVMMNAERSEANDYEWARNRHIRGEFYSHIAPDVRRKLNLYLTYKVH